MFLRLFLDPSYLAYSAWFNCFGFIFNNIPFFFLKKYSLKIKSLPNLINKAQFVIKINRHHKPRHLKSNEQFILVRQSNFPIKNTKKVSKILIEEKSSICSCFAWVTLSKLNFSNLCKSITRLHLQSDQGILKQFLKYLSKVWKAKAHKKDIDLHTFTNLLNIQNIRQKFIKVVKNWQTNF